MLFMISRENHLVMPYLEILGMTMQKFLCFIDDEKLLKSDRTRFGFVKDSQFNPKRGLHFESRFDIAALLNAQRYPYWLCDCQHIIHTKCIE